MEGTEATDGNQATLRVTVLSSCKGRPRRRAAPFPVFPIAVREQRGMSQFALAELSFISSS